jgi:hypothetical protein
VHKGIVRSSATPRFGYAGGYATSTRSATRGRDAFRTSTSTARVKRRTDVVGIFPNEDAIVRLVGAILLEQNDEWADQRARDMTLETIAPLSDDPSVDLPTIAGRSSR